jgi:RNA 3'-terminal phosphate cyclase (ATP)
MSDLLQIDGSQGEGGGQIVRSSLSLALLTGRPIAISQIRAGRKRPGLGRQHLTAVKAAAALSAGEVRGAAVGSSRLEFRPGPVRPGEYHFDVGSAGSTTLVLQTVLPALLVAAGESSLTLEGGTHNPFAPPFDFLARTFLPLVGRLGPQVEARLVRPGFYPAGGGRIEVRVRPAAQLGRLELTARGAVLGRRARVLLARLPRHIAERECRTIAARPGWDASCCEIEQIADCRGPGNAVIIEVESAAGCEVFTAFGRIGVPAERVAAEALADAERFLAADVPVGEHLADQLLLPLGMGAYQGTGGGVFRTLPLTDHATTHIEILRRFLGVAIETQTEANGAALVRVGG